MKKGFKYYPGRCVDCRACVAACVLVNGWKYQPRHVYKSESYDGGSIIISNLSLACNHCDNPACLKGCPSAAYEKDPVSRSVQVNETKCLGCDYCKWNCPYDAPKTNPSNGLIGKCNLCLPLLNEGLIPACSSACPVGALEYSQLNGEKNHSLPEWLPGKNLEPNIRIKENEGNRRLQVVPAATLQTANTGKSGNDISLSGTWSLVAFTFLATWSVGLAGSSFFNGRIPDRFLVFSLLAGQILFSLAHLEKKMRAWRSVLNIMRSPLSREIAAWVMFVILVSATVFTGISFMVLAAAIAGLVLLLAIDSVYTFSDRRVSTILSSGQTFLTGLLMISFFGAMKGPFIFLVIVKMVFQVIRITKDRDNALVSQIRAFRLAFLLIPAVSLITGISWHDIVISVIFITGELADRVLFYIDFEPQSITSRYRY